jgi:hypothetical protein
MESEPHKDMGCPEATPQQITHTAPKRADIRIADVESLARSDAAERGIRSAERLAWLHSSLAVLRKAERPDFYECQNLYVAVHKKRLLERASVDIKT